MEPNISWIKKGNFIEYTQIKNIGSEDSNNEIRLEVISVKENIASIRVTEGYDSKTFKIDTKNKKTIEPIPEYNHDLLFGILTLVSSQSSSVG